MKIIAALPLLVTSASAFTPSVNMVSSRTSSLSMADASAEKPEFYPNISTHSLCETNIATMPEFKKYNSIENSYREKFLEILRDHGYDNDEREYVVQEKVHGCNLSFHMSDDSTTIHTAKRSGFIGEKENFCSYQRVRDRLTEPLLSLFAKVKLDIPDATTVAVYGELFGGMYNHPDVKAVKNVRKVQKGIHYHPDVDFYAFDILVNSETYLNVDLTNEIFEDVGLFYARTLFRGDLKDALSYPNEFDSQIGEWLGLPPIEGNTCEGVVVRPVETLYIPGRPESNRVILKNKNTKWEENQKVQIPGKLGSDASGLQEVLKGYLTTNRVQNVISKIGEQQKLSKKDIEPIVRKFIPDAMEDFVKDYGSAWNALGKKDRKKVIKGLNKYAFEQVRTVLS